MKTKNFLSLTLDPILKHKLLMLVSTLYYQDCNVKGINSSHLGKAIYRNNFSIADLEKIPNVILTDNKLSDEDISAVRVAIQGVFDLN